MKGGIGLATAFRTLTIFRVWGKESSSMTTSLYWFVPVGLVLGLMQWLLYKLLYPAVSAQLAAAVIVAFHVYVTRAFHLDGLADMADGFGGGWTKERILQIMKDSRIGAFGAISIGVLLIVKTAALSALIEQSEGICLIAISSVSRFILVFLSVTQPYARKEGGTAGALINESRLRHLVVSSVQIALIALLFFFDDIFLFLSCVGTAVAVALFVAYKGRKRIDGITGDLLGAACELSEVFMLCIAAFR